MTSAIVEVGPVTVRGPGPDSDLAAIAVAGIDDEIVLVDDEPATVSDLWVEVLDAAAAGARNLTLVCPTWWAADRCDRVRESAARAGAEVVVLQRVQVVSAALSGAWVVVEIAEEVVVVSGADTRRITLARHAEEDLDPETVVRAVMALGGVPDEVAVDAPAEVSGGVVLGNAVVAGLRSRGVRAALAGSRAWRDALVVPDPPVLATPAGRRGRPGRIVLGTAMVLAVALGGIAFAQGRPADQVAMTVLVEGRVGMQIPAGWSVRRITEGPGSARVQVVSPADPQVMIHLTQSGIGDGALADTLRRALREQPPGIFVDFDASAVVAGRPVVSYREVREGREIRWVVFVDGPVRIAIGCQSGQGHAEAVRAPCEAAAGSAHAAS
ncbi:type VII secretion-associated protein [Mycolicibacterium boenickei]|uniref:Type VII secretion-associated protein n=1 Tax=Mycolicibacterium boenickei TaxID=146017 RepID=A0AAX2ZT87_9MYCO|nr:type VII secretion-associated protein [Mycolicibacterium boenickei]PEG62406.1 type VII secretion-associated protein [Mycolicibacterium boenickei]UNB98610.1 type VII secretion-associated protein [Mycolicibacterium boenickei]BBX94449.1 type VII secretion-associated protein [Mycolicibacterium boenickei]